MDDNTIPATEETSEDFDLQKMIMEIESGNDDDDDNEEEEIAVESETENEAASGTDDIDTLDIESVKFEDVKGKTVPLIKQIEERKKRLALEAENKAMKIQLQVMQVETDDKQMQEVYQKKYQAYLDTSNDEKLSKLLADDWLENYKLAKGTIKTEPADKHSIAITALKSESEYYDNADSFADKIKEKMVAFEKAGQPITAKEAYNLVVLPDVRYKELSQRKNYQPNPNKASDTAVISSNGGKPADGVTLSKTDMQALKILQREMPSMNWTAKMYKDTMKKYD